MTKVVYLVQHGKARSEEDDPHRSLTPKGRSETERIAAMVSQLDLDIQEVWHSGKTRAEETAVIFGRALDILLNVKAVDGLHPTDDVKPVAEDIVGNDNAIMIVGHLPFMSRLAGQLVHDDVEKPPVEFHKSGVVCLAQADDNWHVDWQLNPG